MNHKRYNLIIILGHTAGAKTSVAAHLAFRINGEIISADSRQVYRNMDLGTGKDYDDYIINGQKINYHLIDIHEPSYKYNVFEFQKDFLNAYNNIIKKQKNPILCGGSGLYIESVIKGYKMLEVPADYELRKKLEKKTIDELIKILSSYKILHNTTDIDTKKRAVRAIEIEKFHFENKEIQRDFPDINSLVIGIKFDRDSRRRRITERLNKRLENGMIEEVENLLKNALKPNDLIYYGLEYKYITLYLTGKLTYDEMLVKLNAAIHQFAKRQMTWFRRMERSGIKIHWLDGYMPMDEKIEKIEELFKE